MKRLFIILAGVNQGYKPAIKTRECFRECRGE